MFISNVIALYTFNVLFFTVTQISSIINSISYFIINNNIIQILNLNIKEEGKEDMHKNIGWSSCRCIPSSPQKHKQTTPDSGLNSKTLCTCHFVSTHFVASMEQICISIGLYVLLAYSISSVESVVKWVVLQSYTTMLCNQCLAIPAIAHYVDVVPDPCSFPRNTKQSQYNRVTASTTTVVHMTHETSEVIW